MAGSSNHGGALESRRIPALACDAHAHIFGPPETYPASEDATYDPPNVSLSDYLEHADRLGIERFAFVQPSGYGTDNSCLLNALRSVGPEHARGIVEIDPDHVSDADLLCWQELGVRGLRVQSHARSRNDQVVEQFIEKVNNATPLARRFGWYLDFLTPKWLTEILLPMFCDLDVAFAIPHLGLHSGNVEADRAIFDTFLDLAADPNGHCWMKMTGFYRISTDRPLYRDVEPLFKAALDAAPNRLVWGTDYPHLSHAHLADTDQLFDLFLSWIPRGDAVQQIFVDNPSELFGFDT